MAAPFSFAGRFTCHQIKGPRYECNDRQEIKEKGPAAADFYNSGKQGAQGYADGIRYT
jgi:hypothetical protein